MANLQVKGIDDDLYRALKARADREHRSVSRQVIAIIEKHLATAGDDQRRGAADFLELAGSWEDERSAEEIAREIRKARRSKGRNKRMTDVFD